MLGFDHRPSSSCRICTRSQHPELLSELRVPLFPTAFQVCQDCLADYQTSGRSLSELQAPSPPERPFPWPGPRPEDLADASGALAEAIRAQLEVRSERPQAAPEGPLTASQEDLLARAWQAWDDGLPYYELSTPEHARGVVFFSLLTLELGSRAPKLYGRKGGPAEWLKALADQARQRPALRDPRLPWLRAVLAREEGNLATVDRELSLALEWLGAREDAEAWTAVAAGIHAARALRARERSLWGAERDALKAYCRAAPDDEAGFLELARAQLRCARPDVAREILAARVGSAAATPTAVAEEVSRQLGTLRPRLAELHGAAPQAPSPALAYAACLLALEEFDEAWRVLGGSEWLSQVEPSGWSPDGPNEPGADAPEPCDLDPGLRPYLEFSARAALGRGEGERALTLLQAAYDLAQRSGEEEPRVRRDLLAVLQREVVARLDGLEEATRDAEPGEVDERLLSGEGEFTAPGLASLHALLSRHAAALGAELREPVARRALDWFLGRELGSRFAPLVEPPSPLDSDRIRLADSRFRTHLAYRSLARRQLPEALAHDRQARDAVGYGAPIRPLLTFLELVRRGGEGLRTWTTARWLETLAGPSQGELPFAVGLLPVSEEELSAGDVERFALLLDPDHVDRPPDWPALSRLAGRCQLLFPSEGAPEGLPKVPRVRGYLRRLFEAQPGLALLLDWSPEGGMFRLVLGALASPDALILEEPGLNLADESLLASLGALLDGLEESARALDLDPGPARAALLERLPDELRARFSSG